jgi:hypothetical protein
VRVGGKCYNEHHLGPNYLRRASTFLGHNSEIGCGSNVSELLTSTPIVFRIPCLQGAVLLADSGYGEIATGIVE